MQVLGLDDPIAAESGWPRSLLVSVGASGRAACLFHGVTRPLVFVAVSMSRSFVEVKQLHVDPGRRALVDPKRSHDFRASSHRVAIARSAGRVNQRRSSIAPTKSTYARTFADVL